MDKLFNKILSKLDNEDVIVVNKFFNREVSYYTLNNRQQTIIEALIASNITHKENYQWETYLKTLLSYY